MVGKVAVPVAAKFPNEPLANVPVPENVAFVPVIVVNDAEAALRLGMVTRPEERVIVNGTVDCRVPASV